MIRRSDGGMKKKNLLIDLFLSFAKIGLFTFGGGYAMISLIRDVVLSYGWLDDEMLTYMIAVSESTPGPIMVNLATYVGSTRAGLPGALVAVLAVTLPSFIIILLVTAFLKTALKNLCVHKEDMESDLRCVYNQEYERFGEVR